jgi:hypothetical protein
MLFALLRLGASVALAGPAPLAEPVRTGAHAPDDFAVVVGIEDYYALPDVPHALADARAWEDWLVYTRGVPSARVERHIGQPSREALLRGLDAAAAATGPGGTVFVVFAGHGAADLATGEPVLLPAETPPDPDGFRGRSLALSEVHARAGAGGADVMVFTDACYTGAGRSGDALIEGARLAVPAFAQPAAERSVTWTATSANEVALPLPDVGHGAFSYVALQGLRGAADGERSGVPDGRITAEEATLYAQRRLRELGVGSQSPRWEGPTDRVLAEVPLPPPPSPRAEPPPPAEQVATARRPPAPPKEAVGGWVLEGALGTYSHLGLVRRSPGWLRRVGLQSATGFGILTYMTCDAATCVKAFQQGKIAETQTASVPILHPAMAHLAISPSFTRSLARLDIGASAGIALGLHPDHHILPLPAYNVSLRYSTPRGLFLSVGYAENRGYIELMLHEPYSWDRTRILVLSMGTVLVGPASRSEG